MKTSKKRCWACVFLDTIKWGKQAGKQRYKCKNCGILFTGCNEGVRDSNRFVWFCKWVIGRQTLDQLVKESGLSKRTLQRMFAQYLSQPPKLSVYPSEKVNLIIDGTYFTRDLCLILYRDNASQSNGQIDRKKKCKNRQKNSSKPKTRKESQDGCEKCCQRNNQNIQSTKRFDRMVNLKNKKEVILVEKITKMVLLKILRFEL